MAAGNSTDELLYIETELLTVTIKGSPSHPAFPDIVCTDQAASLHISCDDRYDLRTSDERMLSMMQSLGRGWTGQYQLCPLFYEQQRYEIVVEPAEGHTAEFWHENYNVRKSVTTVGRKSSMLSGILNFGNEIGFSDLVIRIDGKNYLKVTIEVFPSKISYKEDYKAIVADVTAEVYNLVFDFLKKTYESYGISDHQSSSPVEFYAIINKIYQEFLKAADMVIARPHHVLEAEHVVLPAHKVRQTDGQTIRWMERHPDRTVRTERGIQTDRVMAVRRYVTYDTKENRLTKYMFQSTAIRLEHFKQQYTKLDRPTDVDVINNIDTMIRSIQRRCNTGFMQDVTAMPMNSGMSLVFSMAPGYRDLYRYYLMLQRGLSISGNVFNISVKDLAALYEYWCFIKLNSLMKDRYEMVSQDIIKTYGNGLFVSLVKGQNSRVKYRNPENGEQITLSYNPSESKGPTVSQRPDNVLSLEKKGAQVRYEYVFDAKYRINPAEEGSYYRKYYKSPGPQEDDINTMHRYRDAIVYNQQASPYERMMFGAYVLFPYRNEEEYRQHRFYKSIEQVNIGGLPFLPSTTGLVTQMLDELISDSPESAFERATLPVGIEDRLLHIDWSRRDVLIGLFSQRVQFDVCYQNKYYYIPVKQVTNADLPIHYVALYQSDNKFPENPGIHYYGEVLRTTLVKRKTITAVPMTRNNPEEMYYLFTVREWIPLERTIRHKELGFPFAFTNMFLLKHMEYIPELLIQSEEEYRFYMELKRRIGPVADDAALKPGFEYGDVKYLFEDNKICVYKNGHLAGSESTATFMHQPNAVFRRLYKYAQVE